MSRLARILISCAIVVSAAAVTATPALAEFEETSVECTTGSIWTLCLLLSSNSKLFEVKGEEGAFLKAEKAIKLSVPSLELEVECPGIKGNSIVWKQLEPLVFGYSTRGALEFEKCAIVGTLKTKCKLLAETVKTTSLTGTPVGTNEIEVKPTSGTVITEIEIGNQTGQTCPSTVKGINPLKGTFIEEINEAEQDAVVKLFTIPASKSSITFGSNAATLAGVVEAELASMRPFSAGLH